MLRSGELLDQKYLVGRLLGSGGMGSVYVAQHVVIGKRVAVKFLHAEYAENSALVERFQQEARAAAAVGHRSIIDIYDLGRAPDGAPYLVMELLDGESLAATMAREARLPAGEAVEIAIHALSALAAAHRKGIIHRDIKPDNIFLERTLSPSPIVKLLDFGISKMSQAALTHATRTGVALGTPHYMAPEQARGELDLDARVDVYAMGVILYEALTGQVPFDAPNYNALLIRVVQTEAVPPRQLRPDLSPELEAVVLRAMHKDRDRRYRRAEDLLEALLPFQEAVRPDRIVAMPAERPSPVPPAAPTLADDTRAVDARAETAISGAHATLTPQAWTTSVDPLAASGDPPPAARRRGIWIAASGAIALGIAAAVIVPAWLGQGPPPSGAAQTPGPPPTGPLAPSPPTVAPPSPLAPPASALAAVPPGPGPSRADVAVIEIADLPVGALVSLDGARVRDLPIRIPRSDVMVRLRVEVEGRAPFDELLTPNRDQTVSVRLGPAPVPRARTVRVGAEPARPAPTKSRAFRDTTEFGP